MKDFDLPQDLVNEFNGTYKNRYYKGYWELIDWEYDVNDNKTKRPHWHNNGLTIILHPYYRNSNEYWFYFKEIDNKIMIRVLGTRYNGRDCWYDFGIIPISERKINKVKRYLEHKLEQKIED